MQKVTLGYEPADALGYFEAISAIPRGSFKEKEVATYIYNFGKELGLDCYMDESFNVVIKKPATKDYENAKPIMLQGHTDIVCVKLPDSDHNFETDPLPLYVEDGILRSKGTTLGADNGNAVSYMMAVLANTELVHPPLECVFTSAEEVGLVGAMKLDENSFTAKRMINMDSGNTEKGFNVVSCAGGVELKMTQKPNWIDATGDGITITIKGLKGGHSAGVISKGRGNAAKLLGRVVNSVSAETPTSISAFDAGTKMNAVPDSGFVTICVEDKEIALNVIKKAMADIKEELRVTDGDMLYIVEDTKVDKVLEKSQGKKFIQFVLIVPSTVRDMSFEIEGHVLCSTNLGSAIISDDEILLWTLTRSGDDSRMIALSEEILALADILEYSVERGACYFGWKYNPESELRKVHTKLAKEILDVDLEVIAGHGGLECGVFYGKEPEMDIITLGPLGEGAHTPEEYLLLDSYKVMYNYLLELLKTLAESEK